MDIILKISDGGSKQKLNMDGLEGLDWILFGNLALLEHLAMQINLVCHVFTRIYFESGNI